MNVGLSYWGFCEKFEDSKEAKTPDGHRYGRPIFVDAMREAGHNVIALQRQRELKQYPGLIYPADDFPDIDVLFIEWRWPTYKNSGPDKFEPDLDRQTELLDHYHGKIPIVIWDCDYKVTAEDELRWPLAIIADPAFTPRELTRRRERLMFWTDWKPLFKMNPSALEYGYIGNNYERPQAFNMYYSRPALALRANGVQTTVHGNWLEISPEREHPSELIRHHPNIAFAHRLNFYESMKRLNSFLCTTHITKPEYAQRGFASPRYLENIVCNVLALVPVEFSRREILGPRWIAYGTDGTLSRIRDIRNMSVQQRDEALQEQAFNLKSLDVFSVSYVVKYLESLKK